MLFYFCRSQLEKCKNENNQLKEKLSKLDMKTEKQRERDKNYKTIIINNKHTYWHSSIHTFDYNRLILNNKILVFWNFIFLGNDLIKMTVSFFYYNNKICYCSPIYRHDLILNRYFKQLIVYYYYYSLNIKFS